MRKKIKLALIAAGRIGMMHAENIFRFPEVELKMIMDKHKRGRSLKNYNKELVITSNINDVWNDPEIDAVVIAASSSAHVDLVKQATKANKHIFCEKPVCFDSKKLYKLSAGVASHKLLFQVAFNRRFDPEFQRVKTLMKSSVGKIYMIKIVNRDPKIPPFEFIPNSGGLFYDFNVHDFDMVHYLSGERVLEVQVMGANLVDPKIGKLGDIDTTLINLRLESGGMVSIDCSRQTGYGYDQQLEVFGAKGSVKAMNLREDTLVVSQSKGVSIAKPRANFMVRYQEAYYLQMQSFIKKLEQSLKGKPAKVEADGFDGAAAVAVAEAVERSFKSGKNEKVRYPS